MSELQAVLTVGSVMYAAAGLTTFIWGHITYTVTLQYPTHPDYEWEKRTGARAMILAPVWPMFVLITHGRAWGRGGGRFVGRVWKDATR